MKVRILPGQPCRNERRGRVTTNKTEGEKDPVDKSNTIAILVQWQNAPLSAEEREFNSRMSRPGGVGVAGNTPPCEGVIEGSSPSHHPRPLSSSGKIAAF